MPWALTLGSIQISSHSILGLRESPYLTIFSHSTRTPNSHAWKFVLTPSTNPPLLVSDIFESSLTSGIIPFSSTYRQILKIRNQCFLEIRAISHTRAHQNVLTALSGNGNNTTQLFLSLGYASSTNFTMGIIPFFSIGIRVILIFLYLKTLPDSP